VKLVCDTNVLIAGVVADGLCRDIVKRRLTQCELFTSQTLLKELSETLREKFGADPDDLPLLAAYKDEASLVKPARLPTPVCRDCDDDVVLATALAAKADVILTGDKDLLTLKAYQGILILSPRQFVERMDQELE
jgi:uncharacterized protein